MPRLFLKREIHAFLCVSRGLQVFNSSPKNVWYETMYLWSFVKGDQYWSAIEKRDGTWCTAVVFKLNTYRDGYGQGILHWCDDWRYTREAGFHGIGNIEQAKTWCEDMMSHWYERKEPDV